MSKEVNEKKDAGKAFIEFAKKSPFLVVMMVFTFLAVILVGISSLYKKKNIIPIAQVAPDDNTIAGNNTSVLDAYDKELSKEEQYVDPAAEEAQVNMEDVVKVDFNVRTKLRSRKEQEEKEKMEQENKKAEELKRQELAQSKANSNSNTPAPKVKTKIIYVKEKEKASAASTPEQKQEVAYDDFAAVYNKNISKNEPSSENGEEKKTKKTSQYIRAVIFGDFKVEGPTQIKLRLTQPAEIDGVKYPRNSVVVGQANYNGSRIDVSAVSINNVELNYPVFDAKDRGEGIYYKSPVVANNTADETKDNTVERTTSRDLGIKNQVINGGVELLKDAGRSLNRNAKRNRNVAFIRDQYKVLIKLN